VGNGARIKRYVTRMTEDEVGLLEGTADQFTNIFLVAAVLPEQPDEGSRYRYPPPAAGTLRVPEL